MVEPEPIWPRYSLIVPAHNEAARIGRMLGAYLDTFADSEVLLVLNGCTDDTEGVARKAAGAHTNLRILRIEHAVGKGGAVRAGFLAASAPVVGYVDADGATRPEEMRRLFESLRDGDDAIIASRWSKGAEVVIAQPMMRRLASRVFNAVVRLTFGLPYHDTQCGAKVFSSEAIRRISNSLEVSNFAFDIDLLYSLRRAGSRIREVPTRWHDIDGSRIDLPRASLGMLFAVLRLRLRHSLFRYIIPLVDRLWPTTTLRVRHGLSVLIVGLDDPAGPQASDDERYLHDVGASLVRNGHRVHWLSAGFPDGTPTATLDGMTIQRVGNRLSARAAIPLTYLRSLRDRFDIIVEVQRGLPLFSPLFSLKPKLCLTTPSRLAPFGEALQRSLLRAIYGTSRFIAITPGHERALGRLGIEDARMETGLNRVFENSEEAVIGDEATRAFLNAVYTEVSRTYSTYVLSGSQWAIVPRRVPLGKAPRNVKRGEKAQNLL